MFSARAQFQTFITIVALALSYYLAAKLVFPLSAPPSNISVFWPSAGIALAFVLKFGTKALPGVFIGSLLKNRDFFDFASQASPIEPIILFLVIPLIATFFTYSGLKLIQNYFKKRLWNLKTAVYLPSQ